MTETRRAILQALEGLSDRYPEMRFGQLVVNVANWTAQQPDHVWDVEDEDFLEAIASHLNRIAATANQATSATG